jgi:excisionase family DNA binding protein
MAETATKWLRTAEVARLLDYSPRSVRRLVDAGALPVVRVGRRGHMRFRAEEIEALAVVA